MTEKPEALLLAKWHDDEALTWGVNQYLKVANELRRLHEMNTDKTEIIDALCGNITELLEELQSAAHVIEALGGSSERYRAAIAKAEGK